MEVFTILYFSTSLISIHMIYRIYSPINWYRTFVLIIDIIGFLYGHIFWDWLQLAPLTMQLFQYILIIIVIGMILAAIISHFVNIYLDRE
ncbi:MAG: hypothetical protein ACLUIS_06045 [Longibaculum sp.]